MIISDLHIHSKYSRATSLSLDIALGAGGLPMGRIVEIYGPESSGKTTLTLECIAAAQKQGKTCAFIDAEHALDPVYAKKLGVDIDALLVSQPDTGEQALEICDALARSGAIDVMVIDSVAALTPKAEIEGEMGDAHMGLRARRHDREAVQTVPHRGSIYLAYTGDGIHNCEVGIETRDVDLGTGIGKPAVQYFKRE